MNVGTEPLRFRYKNWKGVVSVRDVYPIKIYYGNTSWHPEDQWLLNAFDIEKQDERIFAVSDIQEFLKHE